MQILTTDNTKQANFQQNERKMPSITTKRCLLCTGETVLWHVSVCREHLPVKHTHTHTHTHTHVKTTQKSYWVMSGLCTN